MNKSINLIQTKHERSVRLYRVVFYTFIPRLLALLLMSTFVMQPIARASAAELEAQNVVALPTLRAIDIPDTLMDSSDSIVTETTETPVIEQANEATSSVLSNVQANTLDTSQSDSTISTDINAVADDQESTFTATTSDTNIETNDDTEAVSFDDQIIETELLEIEDTASSSILADTVAALTVESDSMVQFDKNDCVAVADGSFYCQPKKAEPLKSEDGLYSYPDSDGDLEIYLQRNGVLKQITFNTVDDAAPYFDAISNTIVWHRQISDRYQIMSYDIDRGIETQLTSDTVNNMEPTRVGKYTAWQRWSGDNWDIVLFDGKETTILTTALEHDIAPHIRGSLVIWNRIGRDQAQTIEIYDIQTGEYTTITDTEGGVISNPRMVLVYESAFKNGDVVTKGYDMQTGEIADLSATPANIPEDIPPPDDTGETRALIQGKLPTKEDLEPGATTTPKIGFDPNIEPVLTGTSTIQLSSSTPVTTTVVDTATTSTNLTLDMVIPPVNPMAEFELTIPPFASSTSE